MRRVWGRLALAIPLFLAGCKGFWTPPSTSGGGGGSTTLSSGAFYVLNQGTNQIAGYSIATGKLTAINAYTLPVVSPFALAISPNGSFLYVSTASGIFLYSIGSGGALTLANNGQSISQDAAGALRIDPTGAWLVDAWIPVTGGPVQLDSIPLASNGTANTSQKVQSITVSLTGASVKGLTISGDGGNVFVALGTAGTIVVPYASGAFGTTFTSIPVQHSLGADLSVAVDPVTTTNSTPRLFYVGETLGNSSGSSGGLRVFNYDSLGTGSLTQVSGSPFATGTSAPNAILPEATGGYVYVANGNGLTAAGNISWFTIASSGTADTVTAGSSVAAGIQPMGLAEDSQNNFVLAVSSGGSTSSGNPDLEAYTMSSGALTSVITSATGTDPVGASAITATP